MALWGLIFLLASNILIVFCANIQDLGGEWNVSEASGKYQNVKAKVPGGIYSDLMTNEIIGDVFFGKNDTATRWVAQTNWTYSRQFLVDETVLSFDNINIVFEGLDTFSTIFINKEEVGSSENMFVRYIFNVKKYLKQGNNTVVVKFVSPLLVANSSTLNQNYTVPPECPPTVYSGECHVNQIRKMQASFSWDWGPAFPSMGIWKDTYLEAFNSSVIRYVLINYEDAEEDQWLIKTTTYLGFSQNGKVNGNLVLTFQTDVSLITQVVKVDSTNNSEDIKVEHSLKIPKIVVKRWWPNGYGNQALYKLTVTFRSGEEQSTKSLNIGFRKIELVQDKEPNDGLSFYFKVNDVPIFAKGANEIPIDILPERGQDPERISKILESAHYANMNMLRVWGGGVYESDYFYEKADELGLLIWQDFMFACALYPTYPEFLENVKAEIRHQVKRLQSHPSIALWAGNNENEFALMGNWYGINPDDLMTYKKDYIKLYIDTIKAELLNITDQIFVSSSPSNGKKTEDDGYLAEFPQSSQYGDVHFYNYILDSLSAVTYPIPRFASEFGYQSLPDVDSWLTATEDIKDLDPHSDFIYYRQHHPLGQVESDFLIYYQLNLNSSNPEYYKTYIFYSQILQAMSIKFETEYYRSFTGRVNSEGLGNTMGALFWQLNDVWVAPTWSSIDFTGKWKMLQYFAKDFFAPNIITGYLDVARQLHIFAVSEVPSLVNLTMDLTAFVEVFKWDSFDVVNSARHNITLGFGRSIEITSIDTDRYLSSVGCGLLNSAQSNCFFHLSLCSGGSAVAPQNFIFPTNLKNANLTKTTVTLSSIEQVDNEGKKFEITLESSGISLFVWLDSHEISGRFNENGFHLISSAKKVTFEALSPTTKSVLEKILSEKHLNNENWT